MDAAKWINTEEEDDDFDNNVFLNLNKDTILFCIDASLSMQAIPKLGAHTEKSKGKPKKGKSHFHQALQCALDVMKRKVIICPNDSAGILFFNTAEKQGDEVLENHYAYMPVSQINADSIIALMELLEGADGDSSYLEKQFPPKTGESVPIGDVFASCNHVLRVGAPKTAIKRIFYITNDDNPGSLEGPAAKRLEDLVAQGISLVPFFISTEEKPFDVNRFYTEVLTAGGSDEDPFPFGDICDGFEQVIAEMRIREMPKRALWSVPFEISDDFTIGVKGYGLVTEQKKPAYKYLAGSGETEDEVIGRTIYYDPDTQTEITKEQVLYGFGGNLGAAKLPTHKDDDPEQGGLAMLGLDEDGISPAARAAAEARRPTKVLFTADQIRSFRTLDLSPGIKLLGFKDSSELMFEDNVKHSYFIYPDESAYTGSTRAFTALLRSCLKHNKIGIARAMMRSNSNPCFCAVVPQAETFDENELQQDPPGFNLIPLPFADEIRDPPLAEAKHASQDLVDNAAQIIKKMLLKKGYQPDAFPNPSLALHYAYLEANALGTEFDKDNVEDHTLPAYERIHAKVGDAIEAWRQQLGQEEDAQIVSKTSRKRATPADGEPAFDEGEIRSKHAAGQLKKLTVAVMKDFLKHKGQKVPTGAKKDDLLELVDAYLEAHPA